MDPPAGTTRLDERNQAPPCCTVGLYTKVYKSSTNGDKLGVVSLDSKMIEMNEDNHPTRLGTTNIIRQIQQRLNIQIIVDKHFTTDAKYRGVQGMYKVGCSVCWDYGDPVHKDYCARCVERLKDYCANDQTIGPAEDYDNRLAIDLETQPIDPAPEMDMGRTSTPPQSSTERRSRKLGV